MAHLSAQVAFAGESGLPEDVFINTFHFSSASADVTAAEVVCDHLVELFTVAAPGGTPANVPITAWYGMAVNHLANKCKIKVYDMDQPMPRPILTTRLFTCAPIGAGYNSDVPAEVALCATFWGVANRPRTRGRVYLGPFGSHALANGTLARGVPQSGVRGSVAGAFSRLINKPANTQNLAIWSRGKYTVNKVAQPEVPGSLTIATDGWVDDGWDTQRRRGQAAVTRTTFT